jgi:quercetin dioxygenase-like cupin family protein
MKADSEFAKAIRDLIRSELALTQAIALSACKTSEWKGRRLVDIAASEEIDVVDLVVKLHEQGGAKAVSFSMSDEDVQFGMTVPWVATASDGSGHAVSPSAAFHPRSFGTFPRKIGLYTLQRNVIPLAQAIRSCSGLPADILGLPERGYLRAKRFADIVVFDPKTYIDKATFEAPAAYATGVRYLFLAGKLALEDGKASEKLYGRALRHVSTLEANTATRGSKPVYSIANCVSELSQEQVEKTDKGWKFWFVPSSLSKGLVFKMTEVSANSANHPPHVHPEEEIIFVFEGEVEFTLSGESKTVGPNSSLYCPPGIPHGVRNVGDTPIRYAIIKVAD